MLWPSLVRCLYDELSCARVHDDALSYAHDDALSYAHDDARAHVLSSCAWSFLYFFFDFLASLYPMAIACLGSVTVGPVLEPL